MMGSLTSCLKQAGTVLSSEDRTAIMERAAELRADGLKPQAAAIRAVEELLFEVHDQLVGLGDERASTSEQKPSGVADAVVDEFPGIDRRAVESAVAAGLTEVEIRSAIDDDYQDGDLEGAKQSLYEAIPDPAESADNQGAETEAEDGQRAVRVEGAQALEPVASAEGGATEGGRGSGIDAAGSGARRDPAASRAANSGSDARSESRVDGAARARSKLEDLTDKIVGAWKSAPAVKWVDGLQDPNVPQEIRDEDAKQRSQGASGAPEGFYYKGAVYLVRGQIKTEADLWRVLFHEALGHGGLRGVFGNELNSILDVVAAGRSLDMQRKAKEYGLDLSDKSQRRQVAEEVLAEMAQTRPTASLVQRAIAAVRQFLRKIGFNLSLSDGDIIANYILPARRFIENGDKGTEGGLPAFSRAADMLTSLRDAKLPAGYMVNDFIKSSGKVSWWDKTVGTMHNLAERSPLFKPVYDAASTFLNDVSHFATEAANLAPTLLPKLETLRDIAKQPLSAEDTRAISAPIFEGTLEWTRDEDGKPVREDDPQKAGIVWTDDELRDKFKLNEKQRGLYREFRASVNHSLTNLVLSDAVRFGGKDIGPVRDAVLAASTIGQASNIVQDHFAQLIDQADAGRAAVLADTAEKIAKKLEQAEKLIGRGYAPLMRFGKYTLDAFDADGKRVYFGLFESQADANRFARQLQGEFKGATINQGTLSEQAYQMFAGVSPETLELFGGMLGLESQGEDASSVAFQEYLKLAKSNRSAMKRLINRKGTEGYSEDAGRVLAGFVYSNARQTSKNLHLGGMTAAVQDIADVKGQGELLDVAVKLQQYVSNPQEEAQAIKGLMFANFLGGSLAAGIVNLSQTVMVSFPYLTQFTSAGSAAKTMGAALRDAAKWETSKSPTTGDAKLDAAIRRAEEDGVISPQEVHGLIAQAGGKSALKAGDGTTAGNLMAAANNALSRGMLLWGRPFAMAEQFNRRATFIAAYRVAVDKGMANPAAFAEKAINDTQFVYTKANRPQWARGAVGGTLFTFKTYAISYVELLSRMAGSGKDGRRAALIGLAALVLVSGIDGLPGAGDLDDLIDGLLQRMGYNFSSKRKRHEFLAGVVGEGGAKFIEKGLSGLPGAPIDVAGRLGMGNLVPGTGLFLKKSDHTQDVAELAGPAGSLASAWFKGANAAVQGDLGQAAQAVMPVAIANVTKAYDMASTGMYRDTRGRKVIDVDGYDAMFKAIGFQPNDVARVQSASREVQSMVDLVKMRETEIADKWARGVFERDTDKVKSARDELASWNAANPEARIKIDSAQVIKRVREMGTSKQERLAKTAPREVRETVRRELEAAR